MPATPPTQETEPVSYTIFHAERAFGLFEYRGAQRHTAILSPQTVTVIEEYGDWLQINTWLGPRWIYLNFVPPTDGLDAVMARFPGIAIFYQNIETGFIYTRYADRVFFGASISKASYALYLYKRAERGEIDLNHVITYTQADWRGGSGVIRHRYRAGATFTTRRVIELNLYESDNIATNMLRRMFGMAGYREFLYSLGAYPGRINYRIFNSMLTAREAGIFALAIWDYTESDARYAGEFRAALLNNQFPFLVSDYPIASKTGWTTNRAWHDMSIVYAPSPYVLVVFSEWYGFRAQDYSDFAEISQAFQTFNDRWFSPGVSTRPKD